MSYSPLGPQQPGQPTPGPEWSDLSGTVNPYGMQVPKAFGSEGQTRISPEPVSYGDSQPIPGPYPQPPAGYPYPPGGYPRPGYPSSWQPGPPYLSPVYYYPAPPQNGLAIASLVTSIVLFSLGIIGLVLGIIALTQINKTGARGRGLAIAGVIIGSFGTAFMASFLLDANGLLFGY